MLCLLLLKVATPSRSNPSEYEQSWWHPLYLHDEDDLCSMTPYPILSSMTALWISEALAGCAAHVLPAINCQDHFWLFWTLANL